MAILVTGGTGYIGSHTCVELLENGYDLIVVDNFSNSSKHSLSKVREITGREVVFYQTDILDKEAMRDIFINHSIDAVIHFAALKAVGESVTKPLAYYRNNVIGTITLLEVMAEYGVKNFVFSSSATVYGDPASVPIKEDFPLAPTNPYGWTKAMMEQILIDTQAASSGWNVILLRYFNPIGAHPSGLIGESPSGIPNNLMPYVSQVAVGKLPELQVFGNDYPTPDGTGVRDYIHVVDLARGHLAALEKFADQPGLEIYNLGTGQGYSVFEIVKTFEDITGQKVPYQVIARRPGDIAECYADPSKAERELAWTAHLGLGKMCEDSWRWQSMNPDGYDTD